MSVATSIGRSPRVSGVTLLALATPGAFDPGLRLIGIRGSIALNWFGPWMVILATR